MAEPNEELCSDDSMESEAAADGAASDVGRASSKAADIDDLPHRGRGGRAQAKALKADAKKRGKGNKVKHGNKLCMPCNREHLATEFPAGKNMCGAAWTAVRNITAAAEKQGQMEWWTSTQAHPHKFRRVVQTYMKNIAPEVMGPKRMKKGLFCCATYIEEVRHAEQLLIDGVYEMLNCAAYQHWAGKAKNGNVDADEAKLRWEQ